MQRQRQKLQVWSFNFHFCHCCLIQNLNRVEPEVYKAMGLFALIISSKLGDRVTHLKRHVSRNLLMWRRAVSSRFTGHYIYASTLTGGASSAVGYGNKLPKRKKAPLNNLGHREFFRTGLRRRGWCLDGFPFNSNNNFLEKHTLFVIHVLWLHPPDKFTAVIWFVLCWINW